MATQEHTIATLPCAIFASFKGKLAPNVHKASMILVGLSKCTQPCFHLFLIHVIFSMCADNLHRTWTGQNSPLNIIFQFGNAVSFNFYKVAGGSTVVGSCNGRNVNSRPLYHLYWGITMDISCLNQFFNEFYRIYTVSQSETKTILLKFWMVFKVRNVKR